MTWCKKVKFDQKDSLLFKTDLISIKNVNVENGFLNIELSDRRLDVINDGIILVSLF